MKLKYLVLALALLLIGCSTSTQTPTPVPPTLTPTITRTPGNPGVYTTSVPDAQTTVDDFLAAWKGENYTQMYAMLTSLTQDAVTAKDFEKAYRSTDVNLTFKSMDYQVLSTLVQSPSSAQAAYRVTYKTTLLNDITRDMMMNLSLENGIWKVQWETGMILPELHGGNSLQLDYKIPSRGNIYDLNGHAIVAQADAVALGVIPGELNSDQEKTMLRVLSILTGMQTDTIRRLYVGQDPTWYIPVGDTSLEEAQAQSNILDNLSGVVLTPFRSRYYFDSGIAAQSIGYVLSISPEQLEEYQRSGYQGSEKIGADGLEAWGEQYLAGVHGATLYVKDSQGQIVTRIAQSEAQAAQSIYTTIDKDLQNKLQASFGNYNGAVIVMEMNTGRILAMVSAPNFDPNIFDPTNRNRDAQLSQLNANTDLPLYNRATQGVYPLGSVFKVVTMSAALESKLFTKDSTYMCNKEFTELAGVTLYDWTYTYKVPASGLLDLPEGLMRSCNPFFWHIGLDLFQQGHGMDVSTMARAFGLGSKTGMLELGEQAGIIPDPESENDAVQLAIGQGAMQVTPLQVVDFIAAVGNGGTLYRPSLIQKIAPIDGQPTFTFSPVVRGKLPVSPENLQIVQDAMRSVVADKRGTAYFTLANLSVPVSGKTGTAETPTGNGEADAWFAGYSMENRPDKPDIAVVVLVENGGEGSEVAAPIFRRAISLYFSNNTNSGGVMPWESNPYVVKSPTPATTDTPTEAPTSSDTTPAP